MLQKAALKISISLAIFFFALAMVGNALSGERVKVPTVTAVVQDEEVSIGSPYVDEGIETRRSHFPDHPELYVPMALPEPIEPKSLSEPENKCISYNMITGKETVHDSIPAYLDVPISSQVMGGMGAGMIDPKKIQSEKTIEEEYGPVPLNFSELSLISNPETYPWCANVKLYMKFASGWYVGSGALIDPMHVITAGHCVHDVIHGGTWASEIVVVPAYEAGWRPYGDASAVGLYSRTEWTEDADSDYDIGVIDLDRPIGALTGYYGYGYNNDPDFYTDNTFYSAGYPAESPYNGDYMYQWHGTFDYTESSLGVYEVGFYRRAYGGQSGSGAYYSGNKCIYAVLSNGYDEPDGPTNYVRITSTEFNNIRDNFIADDTPSTFDLIPLEVTTSPSSITAGDQLSSISYLVHNYSSASWSGTVHVDLYLSTNDNISTKDTRIQSGYFTASFGPKSSVLVNVSTPPSIPKDIAAGDYWIGVILDISDNNTANNDSYGQDASPIHVVCSTPGTPGSPSPSDGAAGVSIDTNLDWSDCANADSYEVYFGTSSSPPYYDTTTSSNYSLPALSYDTHYYWRIVAKNDCGNSASGSVWDFTTGPSPNNPPNTPSTPSGLDSGCIGTSYSFSTSTTDPDGDSVSYRFDWGDGDISSWGGSTQSHSWSSLNNYCVKAQAEDSHGATSGWSNCHFINIINTPPFIDSFTADPPNVNVGDTVTFTCQAHDPDPDGSIASYQWDFDGDGTVDQTTTDGSVSHTYNNAGTYRAEVTVTDDQGAVTSKSVTVTVGCSLPGDANGDGKTTIDEVQKAINQFLGIADVDEPCNDLNSDGRVTIDEVQKVINAFLGK